MSRNTKVQQITSKSGIPLKYKKFNDTIYFDLTSLAKWVKPESKTQTTIKNNFRNKDFLDEYLAIGENYGDFYEVKSDFINFISVEDLIAKTGDSILYQHKSGKKFLGTYAHPKLAIAFVKSYDKTKGYELEDYFQYLLFEYMQTDEAMPEWKDLRGAIDYYQINHRGKYKHKSEIPKHHYMNEAMMICMLVYGYRPSKVEKLTGERPWKDKNPELKRIRKKLMTIDENLLMLGMDKEGRKKSLTSTMQLMRQEVPLLNAYNLKQIEKDNILKLEEQTTKEIN